MNVKTLFIGSGTFAVEILKGLLSSAGIELVGVVTQPDKPAGRKKLLSPCPVGQYVTDSHIPVFKPEKLKIDANQILEKTKPELIIVADYGQIIPEVIINYPEFKCLNVHGSLLPDLRGAVPIPMAILKGYKETGVSIPVMTNKMDDGDVVAYQKEAIKSDDTTGSLKERLAVIGAGLLTKTIPEWVSGNIQPQAQDESMAAYTWQKDISKEKAQITPEMSAKQAEKMVRAFYPWPVAWCRIDNNGKKQMVKLLQVVRLESTDSLSEAGFIKLNKKLYLSLPGGLLEVLTLQVEGKKVMQGHDALFLNQTKLVSS